jgi:MoxR-like ATPase
VPTVGDAELIGRLRDATRAVTVSDDVETYLVALVRATREHADVRLGASPRSSVALYRAAQAWALLEGRDFVLPDDVQDAAHAVLEHRILLDLDRELRGATRYAVIESVLDTVPVPMPAGGDEPA